MYVIEHSARLATVHVQALVARERGASMVEYAILISMIALVALIAVATFGNALGDKYEGIADSIQDAVGP